MNDDVPASVGNLRDRLDSLADDGVLHRLEDASRAGSLARYRNRQSVYQFSELGHRAYAAVEGVLAARVQDANLSRLVFSDILRDLHGLAEANRCGDGDEIVRRLSSLDRVMDDMARRSAHFHLTLGDITRSTDTSPDLFLRYKHTLMAHMTDFMTELDRYLPRLAQCRRRRGAHRHRHAAEPRRRSRRPAADGGGEVLRTGGDGGPPSGPGSPPKPPRPQSCRAGTATRPAVSGVIALLRQITESQRGGVNRSTQLKHLAAWVYDAQDEAAAHALMSAAFNLRWPVTSAARTTTAS